jgi:hypothetical protein
MTEEQCAVPPGCAVAALQFLERAPVCRSAEPQPRLHLGLLPVRAGGGRWSFRTDSRTFHMARSAARSTRTSTQTIPGQ